MIVGAERRSEFEEWIRESHENLEANDMISPELFMEWHHSLQRRDGDESVGEPIDAELTGTTGQIGRYNVIPIENETSVRWLDASGYELAISLIQAEQMGYDAFRDDYVLSIDNGVAEVKRTFTAD